MTIIMKFHGTRPYFVSLPLDDLTGIPLEKVWWLAYIIKTCGFGDLDGEN